MFTKKIIFFAIILCGSLLFTQAGYSQSVWKKQNWNWDRIIKTNKPVGASLRGSSISLDIQLDWAKRAGLRTYETHSEIERAYRKGLLVRLPERANVRFDKSINKKTGGKEFPKKRRYCLPYVGSFLTWLSKKLEKELPKEKIKIISAIRPMDYLFALIYGGKTVEKNINASPRSSHPYGSTIDVAKLESSEPKISISEDLLRWYRKTFFALEKAGVIEVSEEFKRANFHFMVKPPWIK